MLQPEIRKKNQLFPAQDSSCALALLDPEGCFQWVNPEFADLLESKPEALIGDRPDHQYPAARAWLKEGSGTVRWMDAQGQPRWLRTQTQAVQEGTILLVRDITEEQILREENQHLQQQLQDLKLNDDLTGLPNRRAIRQALEQQITRSRRYNNPLAIMLVRVGLGEEQVELVRDSADSLVLASSHFLRDRLRWVDQIGRWEENIFLVILPETAHEDVLKLITKVRSEFGGISLPEPLNALTPELDIGIGIWEKGNDMRTLLGAACRDLACG